MEDKEFRQKVMPLQRLMYAMALKIGLPPDDAADAVQETLLKLWRRREGIPEEEPARNAYCLIAIRNECLTIIKKQRSDLPIEKAAGINSKPTTEAIEAQDTKNLIEHLISYLPDGQKTVIRLSSFGEYDIPEICDATGYSPGNVRQLLSRGRKRLRELLNQFENNERK